MLSKLLSYLYTSRKVAIFGAFVFLDAPMSGLHWRGFHWTHQWAACTWVPLYTHQWSDLHLAWVPLTHHEQLTDNMCSMSDSEIYCCCNFNYSVCFWFWDQVCFASCCQERARFHKKKKKKSWQTPLTLHPPPPPISPSLSLNYY